MYLKEGPWGDTPHGFFCFVEFGFKNKTLIFPIEADGR